MTDATGVTPAPTNLPFTGQVYTLDRTAPVVSSIVRVDPSPTALASVSWTVTFGESVTGVDATDFALAQAGGVSGAFITAVTPVSGTIYTVTASTGTGNGTLGLNLADNDSIIDAVGNPLGGAGAGNGDFSGETYSVIRPVTVTASPTACLNVAGIGTKPWGTLTGPLASDNAYATASVTDNETTNYLQCTGYGFAIPAGATINGITVNVERKASNTLVRDAAMRLVKDVAGVATIQATDRSTLTNYTTADVIEAHGGAADLWGGTWTAADINSGNFGAALASIKAGTAGGARTVSVDHISISVDYTLPPPTALSINLASVNPTNPNTSVDWTVTFSESVSGVDASDFVLAMGGGVSGASITGVSGSGTTWTVTANTGSGIGTLGLNLVDNDSITNGGGQSLGGTGAGNGNFIGQVYTVEAPMTCITDDFATGVLDTALWDVMAISGPFTPQVVNAGGGDFRLRLTDTGTNEATFAQLKPTFPGAGNKIVLEVDYFAYGGTGADGIAVTFSDSAVSSTTGGFGGSLGYAQRTGIDGFGGGWLGIGLDEYGNYPNPTEGRLGYPVGWVAPAPANAAAGFYSTNVSVRGSGSAQTGYNLLANTGVLVTAVNPPSGAAGATPYRYRFTVDHSNGANAWVSVERDTTAPLGDAYTSLVPAFDAKGPSSGQAAVPPSWLVSFTGSTGGSTNFHEFKRVRVCANTIVASGPHHLEIQHASGTGVTCTPSTLTIKACADNAVPCTPYTSGVSGTLSATGAPTVNWDGTTGGAAGAGFVIPNGSSSVTKDVQVTTPGSVVFGVSAATPAPTAGTACDFGAPSCTFTSADAGFLVSAPDHVAESASTLTVQAVKKADNSLQCVPAFASVPKTVNLKCAYVNPASGTLPVRVGGTALNAGNNAAAACDGSGANVSLNFDASGIATPSLQYADVGEMQINAAFTGTAGSLDAGLSMAGSGNFIAAPASFSITGITAGQIKAGNDFSATITALNAAGNAAPNFGQESAAEGVTLTSVLVSPLGGANPVLANGSVAGGAFTNGAAMVANLSWGEVGNITLDAALTSGNYLGSGLNAIGTSATVGPFIPDHFDTAVVPTATLPMPCPTGLTCPVSYDGFVYSGQPFSVQVTALNLSDGTTTNYDGTFGFSKATTLTAWDAKGGATQNPGSGVLGSNAVAAAAFVSGVATLADTPTYTFGTSPTAPTDVYVRAVDADNVTSLRAIPANSVEGGVKVASGRVKIGNAHGSELLPLPMSATVQYYDETYWTTSATDNVTSFDTTLSTSGGNLVAAIISGLGGGITVSSPGTAAVVGGVRTFRLSAPGVPGSASISLNAPSYLPSNTARATFGVYKGNNEFIYLRETY